MTQKIRPAQPKDAPMLAKLVDIAGDGVPGWYWSTQAQPGQSALEFGAACIQETDSNFSYRNCVVAEQDGAVVGAMIGYVITAPSDAEVAQLPTLPKPIRPMVELEHKSVGTYYITVLAVKPGLRGAGLGRALLAAAENKAQDLGVRTISLQVFSQNQGARRLYEKAGYHEVAKSPILQHPTPPYYDEDNLLLFKDI